MDTQKVDAAELAENVDEYMEFWRSDENKEGRAQFREEKLANERQAKNNGMIVGGVLGAVLGVVLTMMDAQDAAVDSSVGLVFAGTGIMALLGGLIGRAVLVKYLVRRG